VSLSESDLKAIEDRAGKATPGPWFAEEEGGYGFGGPTIDREVQPRLSVCWVEVAPRDGSDEPDEIARIRTSVKQHGLPEAWENQRFIAHARQDVPALLADLRGALLAAAMFEEGAAEWESDCKDARRERDEARAELSRVRSELEAALKAQDEWKAAHDIERGSR
jgi:hypothetical protein